MVFPRDHCPVLGAVMVVLRFVVGAGAAPARAVSAALSTATPLVGIAEAVDASDA